MWDKWLMFNGFSNLCLSSVFLRVCVCDHLLYPYRRCFWGMCCPFHYLIESITYIHLTHRSAETPIGNCRDLAGGLDALDDLESGQSKTGTDGTCATATSNDINTAIDEIKQAGLWPWKGSGIE